jgi:Na+-driven multidrug efflux pump
MQFPKSKRLIICLWSLPISGILAIFALFLRNFVGLPGENLLEWAQAVSSNAYLFSQYMYILAYVLPFFGFWALYMYLLQVDGDPDWHRFTFNNTGRFCICKS